MASKTWCTRLFYTGGDGALCYNDSPPCSYSAAQAEVSRVNGHGGNRNNVANAYAVAVNVGDLSHTKGARQVVCTDTYKRRGGCGMPSDAKSRKPARPKVVARPRPERVRAEPLPDFDLESLVARALEAAGEWIEDRRGRRQAA